MTIKFNDIERLTEMEGIGFEKNKYLLKEVLAVVCSRNCMSCFGDYT